MAPPAPRTERRRFPRRAKSVRFHFEHGNERHFAVTTFVSLVGAYLKASHVPPPGTVLTLNERFNADGVGVVLQGEVIWAQHAPSLERPETGFGLRFMEVATRSDPGHLEDFLRSLDPTQVASEIEFEERPTGAHAVYRFPSITLDPALYSDEEPTFSELDEPLVVDLDHELERLQRDEGFRTAAEASAITIEDEVPPVELEPNDTEELDPARLRSRSKRSVTGLFTALFARVGRDHEDGAEADATATEVTLIHDERRPKVLMSWAKSRVLARIESLGRGGAMLWTNDIAPGRGEEVTLTPVGSGGVRELLIQARITTREDRPQSGVSWLSLEFVNVDERGRRGSFQEYLRYVNGPNAD